MNDMIGVSGLEAVYEDELRGKDGVETITRSSDGVIVGTAMTTVPEPGHTVQLTIDSAFQQAVDKALARNIEMINSTYNSGSSAKLPPVRWWSSARRTAVCWPPPTTPATTRTSSPPSTASTARTRACPCSTALCGPVHPRLHLQACGGGGGAGFRRHQPLFHRLLQRCLYLL